MAISKVSIANVGSPADDPGLFLPGQLWVPDPAAFPPPWPCFVATLADRFQNARNIFTVLDPSLSDLANAGYLCLGHNVRLTTPLTGAGFGTGQTTTGTYHQQTNDLKIGIRAMRLSNMFGTTYKVINWVGTLGGSGSAHHALYCVLDGTQYDDKSDACIAMSPVTDFSDRSADVPPNIVSTFVEYNAGVTDLPTLLSHSPIALNLASTTPKSPIVHVNAITETMPITQFSRFHDAMTAIGRGSGIPPFIDYIGLQATGPDASFHSFQLWPFLMANSVIAEINLFVTPGPPPTPPPPGQLHLPTFTPFTSFTPDVDVTIACSDSGSHLFYTIGDPSKGDIPDPTHLLDSPTAGTHRIGSNSGVVNTGGALAQIKCLAYKSGSTDSDVATSGRYGKPPQDALVSDSPGLTGQYQKYFG